MEDTSIQTILFVAMIPISASFRHELYYAGAAQGGDAVHR